MAKVIRILHHWHTKAAIEWLRIAAAEPVQGFAESARGDFNPGHGKPPAGASGRPPGAGRK